MKKIFTLIAVAMMAFTAQAQEVLLFENGAEYVDGQEFTTKSTKLALGYDFDKWTVSATSVPEGFEESAFVQQVTVKNDETNEDELKARIVKVVGKQNPKDKAAKNSGSGFNAAETKTTGRLPRSGTYYVLTTSKAGHVSFGVELAPDKAFYLIDATEAALSEDEVYLQVALPDANRHDYKMLNVFGDEIELSDDADGKGGKIYSEDKQLATIEFDAAAGSTYYLFCAGSKLGAFGYVFTEGMPEGISGVEAQSKNATFFNLAGQKVDSQYRGVVVKNGKKLFQ